ncbi:MBL fold metallo-hydrolase [Enemella evansiae]|uniref:MBL fold metallo-hydrolase n=1 Tax=Enemella evansiae TaxID=2016499 RepID=UPI0010620966|nr:MBL fold metallo-hydrolase [Enemella evansiae]TDO86204.1 RNAse Z [Enemella evansiae]
MTSQQSSVLSDSASSGADETVAVPRVITLGTAGGPRWWRDQIGRPRFGIATAIVLGEDWYLVDCGTGAFFQAAAAGLDLARLRGVFLTHLHSDHVVDLASLLLFAPIHFRGREVPPVPIIGPGDRGKLPPVASSAASTPQPVAPDNPTPGTRGLVDGLVRAYATDLNDRIFDSLVPTPDALLQVVEIAIPAEVGFDPNDAVAPPMEPLVVFSDEQVVVSATLVSHHPTAPAYAFRFDLAGVSVTISGDTAPCDNLVRLARGTDLLLHEAIAIEQMERTHDSSPAQRAAMAHHRRAHTTPAEAGEIAERAGARRLALHHLVPAWAPEEAWQQARSTYSGELLVPDDGETVELAVRGAGEVRR